MTWPLTQHTSSPPRGASVLCVGGRRSYAAFLGLALAVAMGFAPGARADDGEPQQVAHVGGFTWLDQIQPLGPPKGGGELDGTAASLPGVPAVLAEHAARVILPPRPPATFAVWAIRLPVPLIRQIGDKSNCGPSAAAMAVGAYDVAGSPASLRDLRNAIGEWTWQRFPRRQRRAEGSDAGGTTRAMMQQSLNRFGEPAWVDTRHTWVPEELWSLITLRRSLAERRPLVVLAEASPLWGIGAPGLHWVVVTGFERGHVLMHDPADGREAAVPLQTFWRAWRLPERYHAGPGRRGYEGLVADMSLPVPLTAVPEARHLAYEALERF